MNRTIHNAYLTKEQESDLVQYRTYMAHTGWPLVSDDGRDLAIQILLLSGKSSEPDHPSIRWAQRFIKKKGLTLRNPGTKHAGQMIVKQEDVDKYFQLISKRFEELSILDKPGNIVNMAETGHGSRTEFLLPLEEFCMNVKVDPLHLLNLAWQHWHTRFVNYNFQQ